MGAKRRGEAHLHAAHWSDWFAGHLVFLYRSLFVVVGLADGQHRR